MQNQIIRLLSLAFLFSTCFVEKYNVEMNVTVATPKNQPLAGRTVVFKETFVCAGNPNNKTVNKTTDSNGRTNHNFSGNIPECEGSWTIEVVETGNLLALNSLKLSGSTPNKNSKLSGTITTDEIKPFRIRVIKNTLDTGVVRVKSFFKNSEKDIEFTRFEKTALGKLDTTFAAKGFDFADFRVNGTVSGMSNNTVMANTETLLKVSTMTDSVFVVRF